MLPAIAAFSPLLSRNLPPKQWPPPFENRMLMGLLASRAACSAALTVCEPITFTAGRAAFTLFRYANNSCSAEPVTTPGLSFILDMLRQFPRSERRVHRAGAGRRLARGACWIERAER